MERTGQSNEPLRGNTRNRSWLLVTGMLGPLVFVFNVVLGGILTPDYSHTRHAVSELTQSGAQNIVLLSLFFILSALLILVFGVEVYYKYHRCRIKESKKSHYRDINNLGGNERVAQGGVWIALYALQAILLASIFPQDPIGTKATIPGTMHLVLVATSALCIVAAILMIGSGVDPRPPRYSSSSSIQQNHYWSGFRLYSIASVVVMLGSGASTGILIAYDIPMLGLVERITQLAYLQWFVTFACKMILE